MSEEKAPIPHHIAFILDGNRRFAKSLQQDVHKGHEQGFEKLKTILRHCKEKYNIKEVTFYAMSLQNFNRPESEKVYLMKLFRRAVHELETDKRFDSDHGTKICFIGKKELFPQDIQEQMTKLEEKTKNNTKQRINFCMAYGGREEILFACQRIAQKVKEGKLEPQDIDEHVIQDNLWLDSCPDLIIRTSGEIRTSNFLPWQSVYSEWMFPDCYWPEFDEKKLDACIEEYTKRNRRFGK